MSRYFMIQSWVGSHENEPDYNGQQASERNVRSREVVPLYDQFGNANIQAFSDEALNGRIVNNKPKPIAEQIVPQSATLNKLDDQERKLEKEYQDGKIDIEEYEELFYALSLRRERAFKSYMRNIGKYDEWLAEQQQELMQWNFEQKAADNHQWQKLEFEEKCWEITKNVCKNMSKNLVDIVKKQWQYGQTKQEFEGQDVAFWAILGICSSVILWSVL